jgi:hypothetical protein
MGKSAAIKEIERSRAQAKLWLAMFIRMEDEGMTVGEQLLMLARVLEAAAGAADGEQRVALAQQMAAELIQTGQEHGLALGDTVSSLGRHVSFLAGRL